MLSDVMELVSLESQPVIPHRLKMELMTLLDPFDHVYGRDWRLLASELRLDGKIHYLESKPNPTELLLRKWEARSETLVTLAVLLRNMKRGDAAALVENHISSTIEKTLDANQTKPSPCGVGVVSLDYRIPEELKSSLAMLLDPVDPVTGHDWCHLASQLGLDFKIDYMKSRGNPTHQLLVVCESRQFGMLTLVAMMRSMGREDAAKVIEQYDCKKEPEAARKGAENLQETERCIERQCIAVDRCASASLPMSTAREQTLVSEAQPHVEIIVDCRRVLKTIIINIIALLVSFLRILNLAVIHSKATAI